MEDSRIDERTDEDGMVEIEVDLDNEKLLALAMEAHRLDITLNVLINDILRESLKNFEEENDD